MRSTIVSENNRYKFLIALDVGLDVNGNFSCDLSFGKVAPGFTSDYVRYCVKRVTLEINARGARFSKVHLLDPANIADGVEIERAKELGGQKETASWSTDKASGHASLNPSASVSSEGGSVKKGKEEIRTKDTFRFEKFTFSCYGDKKYNPRWDFEPFEEGCLRGNLKRLLVSVVPEEGKRAFLLDAIVIIRQEDIKPVLKEKENAFRKAQERVLQWFSKKPLDLSSPVSNIQLSVSNEDADDKVNAA